MLPCPDDIAPMSPVGDTRSSSDEEQVEPTLRETLMQGRQVVGLVDVEMLEGDAPVGSVCEMVQGCSGSGVADRADDAPTPVEEFGRHRVAEATRGPDDESGRRVPAGGG